MNIQFNFKPLRLRDISVIGFTGAIEEIVKFVNDNFTLVARGLRGPVAFDAGDSGAAKTVKPWIADVTQLRLTADTTVTLELTDTRRGMAGDIEFTQDGTGGWMVAFTNLMNAAPAVTATAGKRTLIRCTHVGDGWVATVLASNY